MASTPQESASPPQEPEPISTKRPLSPNSREVLETAARHALNVEDSSFLITVLNELADPVLKYRAQMILDYLVDFYPNPLCQRLSKIFVCPPVTISDAGSAVSRKIFDSLFPNAFWPEFLKPSLLELNKNDDTKINITSIKDISSCFIPHYIPEHAWPDFTTALYGSLDSDNELVLELALSLIDKSFTGGLEKMFEPSLETLCNKIKQILSSQQVSLKLKEVVVEISFCCISALTSSVNDKFLQDLLRKVMNTVFFNGGIKFDMSQEGYARLILEKLVVLATTEAWFLRNQIDKVLKFMFSIMENPEYEESTRFLAIEFVLVLVEDSKGCQILVNTGGLHIKRMLSHLLSMIATIDENLTWDDNDKEQEPLTFLSHGMESMGRFSLALGGRFLLEGFPQPFESYLSSETWQRRCGALISLSVITKNCPEALKSKVHLVANPVIKLVEDVHHHVRWEALCAIEDFSKLLHPEFQNDYHQKVLPALAKALNDFSDSSIQEQAAMATYYFSEECTSNMLKPHLDEIISKLLRCLQKGQLGLKEWALSALAAIARSSQDLFLEYYRTVMPYLKVVMKKATDEANGMLLSASVECITVVWMVVGKEKFNDDSEEVLKLLVFISISKLKIDDPMRIEGLRAWGRLCKCLGHDFQPYMEVAIPCLLESAQLTLPDDAYMESDERYRKVLKEKATACHSLRDCAAELKEGIDLWIDEVAETLVPLLNFYQHDDVRIAAVLAMPEILKSSKAAMEKRNLQESRFEKLCSCSYVITALVEALDKEEVIKIKAIMLDSLEDCLEIPGPVLNTDQIKRFLVVIMDVLRTSISISEDDEEIEQREKVCNKVCTCLKTFIRTYRASLSQFFDQLLSSMEHMWVNDKTSKEREIALKIFTDVVEEFGEEALKSCESNLLLLFKACNVDEPEVQEVVAHATGVAAAFGGSIFKPLVGEALSALYENIGHPRALRRDYMLAHDAAVSALGKICMFHKDRIKATEVFGRWLSHLPIKNNLVQAKTTHDMLCSMVEMSKAELLHRDAAYLPKIISIFAEILWADDDSLATKETTNRVIDQLTDFKSRLPSNVWSSILSSLEPSRQNVLRLSLSSS